MLVRWRIQDVGSNIYDTASDKPWEDTTVVSANGAENYSDDIIGGRCDGSFQVSIAPGSTAEGCILIAMDPGQRGTLVRFTTDDNVGAARAEWTLPATTPITRAPQSPGAVPVSLPSVGLLWLRQDAHCHVPDYSDPITGQHCTPLGMRSGVIGGVLDNDPQLRGIGLHGRAERLEAD